MRPRVHTGTFSAINLLNKRLIRASVNANSYVKMIRMPTLESLLYVTLVLYLFDSLVSTYNSKML
jgi:hypothetical protein